MSFLKILRYVDNLVAKNIKLDEAMGFNVCKLELINIENTKNTCIYIQNSGLMFKHNLQRGIFTLKVSNGCTAALSQGENSSIKNKPCAGTVHQLFFSGSTVFLSYC